MFVANTFLGGSAAAASAAGSATALTWSNLFGTGNTIARGSTNSQTVAGLSGPSSFKVDFTGAATMYYVLNGGSPVPFNSGDSIAVANTNTLSFTGEADISTSGAVTVTCGGALVGGFTYVLNVLSIHLGVGFFA